ncbi:family 43 glycosylhydrolase [Konateibacter massiliensis]|uniref:family 43 glycosylhydrolase n=1 Tax=Konateibacter massiliensis TaxID=2002841 RepID=UPI000C14922F|nr:family 43 glycosylhydrolase [Konateibacter massiliensis]
MKKKFLLSVLALSMVVGLEGIVSQAVSGDTTIKETVISKSELGNPVAGFDANGNVIYGGDSSVLVDGDTVYLYVGHDASTNDGYVMPNYLCYSTQDMKNWTYHGVVMDMKNVSWGTTDTAWAGQVTKQNGKYYMYYCAANTKDNYDKAIGVAVSDSPTGTFVDIGSALIAGSQTNRNSFQWQDIDPTVWKDTDDNGEEHIYLAWGNTHLFMCELNQDMISVKDQNGDSKITLDEDLWQQSITGMSGTYTEAPWLYHRQDESGNYYGKYYLFYAMNWREEMAYATTDDLTNGTWTFGGRIMEPSATSNTNHMAVFDFDGKTYFMYHNGSLPWGSGYRRVASIEEMTFADDGSVNYIQETATGLTGTSNQILNSDNELVAHENFANSLSDSAYPITKSVLTSSSADKSDAMWEIVPGKADKANEAYVSIESYNKPGLYLSVDSSYNIILTQDYRSANSSGITADSNKMTFRTLEGFSGSGVTFESVAYPGYYLTSAKGKLILSQNPNNKDCTFTVAKSADITSVKARKTTRSYYAGDTLKDNDIRLTINYDDGTSESVLKGYISNASSIDMSKAGIKTLTVSYTEKGITKTADISVTVQSKPSAAQTEIPIKNGIYQVGNLKYEVTKSAEKGGTVTVAGAKSDTLKSITIPKTVEIDGYTFNVTAIGSGAFEDMKKLKTITIGDNIKSIGSNAFKGINKAAVFKVSSSKYKTMKKLLTSKTGYSSKTMTIKKI